MSEQDISEFQAITEAISGLDYPSESDAPFEAFEWTGGPGTTAASLVAARVNRGEGIEPLSLDAFFQPLEDTDDAARFADLRRILATNLKGLQAFVVNRGGIEVHYYVVGQTSRGSWMGVHTIAVET